MKNNHLHHVSQLIFAMLFVSTSGVLGKYIAMPSEIIVWFRAFLAVFFLYVYCRYKKIDLSVKMKKDYWTLIVGGLLMAGHWITYFYALKLSNVAIGMLSLFTFPVITALLEPLFNKTKFNPIHIVLGLMVLCGIYILSPEFDLESTHVQGILYGLVSAVFFSIRFLILKRQVAKYNGTMLMLYQMVVISIVLAPLLFFMDVSGIETQYPYVLLLAIITTAIGHTMMIKTLNYFSASTASIISSVQPVFGIVLAFIFLNEIPSSNTFWGGLLILSTVVIESVRSKQK